MDEPMFPVIMQGGRKKTAQMISAFRRDKFLLGHLLHRCRRAASTVDVERDDSAV